MLWDDPLLGVASGNVDDALATTLSQHWRSIALALDSALMEGGEHLNAFAVQRLRLPALIAKICSVKVCAVLPPATFDLCIVYV